MNPYYTAFEDACAFVGWSLFWAGMMGVAVWWYYYS